MRQNKKQRKELRSEQQGKLSMKNRHHALFFFLHFGICTVLSLVRGSLSPKTKRMDLDIKEAYVYMREDK